MHIINVFVISIQTSVMIDLLSEQFEVCDHMQYY